MADAIQVGGAKLFRLAEMEPEKMSPTLSRQFCSGEQVMLARILFKQGCVVPQHQHSNEQISFVLSGALEFVIGGVTQVVRAGEMLVIPGGVPHAVLALEDTENLDAFAPPRQDWIDNDDSYLRGKG